MLESVFGGGKLEKMIIRAFKPTAKAKDKPVLSDADGDKYMVQVNPDNYAINYRVNYNRKPAPGNSGSVARYTHTSPPGLEFTFLFDGTGVVPKPAGPLDNVPIAGAIADLISGGDEYDVMTELQKFAKVVYLFEGKEHRPRRVQLNWGSSCSRGCSVRSPSLINSLSQTERPYARKRGPGLKDRLRICCGKGGEQKLARPYARPPGDRRRYHPVIVPGHLRHARHLH